MELVRSTFYENQAPESLTEEDLKWMEEMKTRPIDYSDDPKRTREELHEMRLAAERRLKRKIRKLFSLQIEYGTLRWWKHFGKGYTDIMAKYLDNAKKHPEWVKECIEDDRD